MYLQESHQKGFLLFCPSFCKFNKQIILLSLLSFTKFLKKNPQASYLHEKLSSDAKYSIQTLEWIKASFDVFPIVK